MKLLIALALLALLCGCGGQMQLTPLNRGNVLTCQIGEQVVADGNKAYCKETEGK